MKMKNNVINIYGKEDNECCIEIMEINNSNKNDSLSYEKIIKKEDDNNLLKTNIKNIITSASDDKIVQETKIEQNKIEQNDKKKKTSCWFCCGKDSVDVID